MTAREETMRPEAPPSGGLRDWRALAPEAARIAWLETREARMRAFVALAWRHGAPTGVSWLGFYVDRPDAPADERLELAAREPGPACSPIGVHGACGRCLLSGTPLVIHDIRELGSAYIACDPRDLSELVLPCRAADGSVWGVFDLDSHETGSFSTADGVDLGYLLGLAGLDS